MDAVLQCYEAVIEMELVPPITIELVHLGNRLIKGHTLDNQGVRADAVLTMELTAFVEGVETKLAKSEPPHYYCSQPQLAEPV